MPKPLHLRKLRAEMVLKELDLRKVATGAGIPYTTASEILSGRRLDPVRLSELKKVVSNTPMPEGAQA